MSNTKINPPKKKRTKPVAPPADIQQSNNLSKPERTGTAQIKFLVDANLRREFKTYAAENDTSMSDLFVRMYEFYREKH